MKKSQFKFMATHGRGLICLSISGDDQDRPRSNKCPESDAFWPQYREYEREHEQIEERARILLED